MGWINAVVIVGTLQAGCSLINAFTGTSCNCGDGICDPVCGEDCGCNGDGVCDISVENTSSCASDCQCNDNAICEPGEAAGACAIDCGQRDECRKDDLCGLIWAVNFQGGIDLATCTGGIPVGVGSDNLSQRQDDCSGHIDGLHPGGQPIQPLRIDGQVSAQTISATMTCVDQPTTSGQFLVNWTGSRYDGTWDFAGQSGSLTVIPTP